MVGEGEVDGTRTVECLRGRLLAERLVSRAAREEAELMSRRLMEVERLLAVEIKARDRAEKRLKRVLKKLDSLSIFDVSSQSNVSKGSSLNEGSAECYADGKMKRTQNLSSAEDTGDEASGTMSPGSVSASQEGSWVSARTGHSHNDKNPSGGEIMEFQYSPKSLYAGELSADNMSIRATDEKEPDRSQQKTENVDDRLALVPARIWADSQVTNEPQNSSGTQGVLIALKLVKMQLQNSMGRKAALSPNELNLY